MSSFYDKDKRVTLSGAPPAPGMEDAPAPQPIDATGMHGDYSYRRDAEARLGKAAGAGGATVIPTPVGKSYDPQIGLDRAADFVALLPWSKDPEPSPPDAAVPASHDTLFRVLEGIRAEARTA